MNSESVLSGVTGKTNSELILFFIIIAVVFVVSIPSLIVYLRYRAKKDMERTLAKIKAESSQFENWTAREAQIINVIEKNGENSVKIAEALTKLSTVLEVNNRNCDECKTGQFNLWQGVDAKLNEALIILKGG